MWTTFQLTNTFLLQNSDTAHTLLLHADTLLQDPLRVAFREKYDMLLNVSSNMGSLMDQTNTMMQVYNFSSSFPHLMTKAHQLMEDMTGIMENGFSFGLPHRTV
jgi:hypothetical protein